MTFKSNEYQQITMDDRFLNLDKRKKKIFKSYFKYEY
ncbi:MAG: hypothetical protein ACFWT2_11240 [Thermoanaerobacterium thermosaccharolyticum]